MLESLLHSAVFLKLLHNDFGFPELFKLTKKASKQTGVKQKGGKTVWIVPGMAKNGDAGTQVSVLVPEKVNGGKGIQEEQSNWLQIGKNAIVENNNDNGNRATCNGLGMTSCILIHPFCLVLWWRIRKLCLSWGWVACLTQWFKH